MTLLVHKLSTIIDFSGYCVDKLTDIWRYKLRGQGGMRFSNRLILLGAMHRIKLLVTDDFPFLAYVMHQNI